MKTWTTRRREIKLHARKSLAGNFIKGIFAALLSFAASSVALSFLPIAIPPLSAKPESLSELLSLFFPNGITPEIIELFVVSSLLYLILGSPLLIGTHRFYLHASRGEKPKFLVVLSSFANLREVFSSCLLTIATVVSEALIALVLFAIPLVMVVLSPVFGPLMLVGGVALYIVAAVILLIVLSPFTLAPFVFAENPPRGAFKSIMLAFKFSRGRMRELCVFRLSFILWLLLFGMNIPGSFFITPYISMATATFYNRLKEKE